MKRIAIAVLAMLVCVSVSIEAQAQADIGVKGAGVKLSFVSPDNIDGTIGFGGILDLGTFTPEIGFQATLDFWSKTEDFPGGGEASFRDIALGARASYNFPMENESITPYAAAGLAIHIFHSEVDFPPVVVLGTTVPGTGGTVDDTETKIGLDLAGGAAFKVGENVDIIAELMFRVVSDVSQFIVSGGAVFWFGG